MKSDISFLFKNVLANPQSGEQFIFNNRSGKIENIDQARYKVGILDNIPVILPKKVDAELNTSDFHKKTKSNYRRSYSSCASLPTRRKAT